MKLMGGTLGIALLVGLIAAGCGHATQNDASSQGMASMPAAAPPAAPMTSMQDIDVTFKTEPDPPKVGENTFEAMVMAGAQPVTDGGVSDEARRERSLSRHRQCGYGGRVGSHGQGDAEWPGNRLAQIPRDGQGSVAAP